MANISKTSIALDKASARQIWLHAQRLDEPQPFGKGADATRLAVKHLGYVQIDTINVIERCHHHILHTRIPDYRREHLTRAQSLDKSVFEYWAHALAYLPATDMRFFTAAMKERWRNRHASTVKQEELRKVLKRIRTNGPLTLRDIDDDELVEKDHAWASRKPSARALKLAFNGGQLTVSARTGILKTYELSGRHFGFAQPKPAPERETLNYLLDRALRSQGIVSLDSICYMDAPRKKRMRALIQSRMRRKELVALDIEGAGKTEHWATPATLDTNPPRDHGLIHILSPFDPLVIQRKRLKFFFGYEHCFEAYVPKPKRKYGYFALPVLVDDAIAAVIDLKADRAAGKLLVQQWTWLGPRSHKRRIEEALHPFEQFQLGK